MYLVLNFTILQTLGFKKFSTFEILVVLSGNFSLKFTFLLWQIILQFKFECFQRKYSFKFTLFGGLSCKFCRDLKDFIQHAFSAVFAFANFLPNAKI